MQTIDIQGARCFRRLRGTDAGGAALMTLLVLVLLAAGMTSAFAGEGGAHHGLPAEGSPEAGVTTAAQPSPEQLRELAAAGYTTVINLRTDAEMPFDEREMVESLGMTYRTIPIGAASDVSEAGARQLDDYLNAADGPVLVHCATSNRVGALYAVRAHLAGADTDEALRIGKAAGLGSLEERVREVIEAEQ